jgi:hypothetical protein
MYRAFRLVASSCEIRAISTGNSVETDKVRIIACMYLQVSTTLQPLAATCTDVTTHVIKHKLDSLGVLDAKPVLRVESLWLHVKVYHHIILHKARKERSVTTSSLAGSVLSASHIA